MKAQVCLVLATTALVAFIVVAATNGTVATETAGGSTVTPTPSMTFTPSMPSSVVPPSTGAPSSDVSTPPAPAPVPPWRPGSVFGDKFLVAYYGTAGTGSLGVLGSQPLPRATARLRTAAAPFAAASGKEVQIVYELIVTMADPLPGDDGTYSHDISRSDVQRYVRAARRNHALLILDLQPGRSDFLSVAKRYAWALKLPDVGLALDPEWRMHGDDVPGQVFGSVSAAEVNATARYVAGIARRGRLPQKLFMIHQFTPESVVDIAKVKPVKGLAMVQHVDGWGGQSQKLATYHSVARPRQFTVGFKLFYSEDVDMFTPAQLLRAVPAVRFVSYQ